MSDQSTKFDRVVVPHLSDALTLARWLVGNRAAAEDIVQDACLRAFRGINDFADGNAKSWVLTIVRNTAYSWLVKNRTAMLVSVEDLNIKERAYVERGGGLASPSAATPESELIMRSETARIEAAIEALPAEFRETLVLHDIQGLKYREIAEVTGTPVGTVMSRLARARRRLMDAVKVDEA